MPGKYDAFLRSSAEAGRNRRNESSSLNNAQQRTGRYDDFISQSRGFSNRAVPVTPPVQPQEESGFFTNVAKAPLDRSAELTGNFFEFLNTLGQSAEEKLYQMGLNIGFEPDEDGNYKFARNVDPNLTQNMADPVVDLLESAQENIDYDPNRGVSWEEYKDDWTSPKKLASFILEQGVKSVPDMAATLTALPAYVASRTQEIAEAREVNKTYDPATNTFIDDPDGRVTATDLVEALPTAVAVALAERVGAKSIFTPKPGDTIKKRTARGAASEGATEFVQENIEYAGEVLGTPVDYDLKTGLDRGVAGLVAGAGIGGPLAAGDGLLRGNPLAEAVDQGRQDAQSKGGDGLDQAAAAAGNAASKPLDRQRARMGLNTEPEVLIDPVDLAGTSPENPIVVDGTKATVTTPSGTTTFEMDTPAQSLEAAEAFKARNATPELPASEPQARQPLTPLGSPTNDPLQSLADTILLNEKDLAAADAAGDIDGANALYEDNARLRAAERQLRRANALAQEGNTEASDAIIARVMPTLQEEAGRRQVMMDPVQVESDPLLLEDQGVIFAEGSTEPLNLPARVTKLKSNGAAYPTQKAAEAAMTRVRRGEPEYVWSVKRASGGFALEGNLPNTKAVNETISPAVFEAAQNRISQNVEDQRRMSQATELEAVTEGSGEVSISDQLAAYESELSETTATLNALQARLAEETKRDQSGVLVKNPIKRAMTIKDTDDLLLTIVKLGGINIEDANGNGFEPKLDNPKSNSVGAYRLFKKDGMTFDELREALQERGWYSQEDPNRPSVLGANEVMEDIREAVILAQDNEFVYKGDKQAEIEFLKRDISFAEESLSELEGIVSSYKSQLSPEEAGRTDFIGITDSDVLNSINYFDEIQGAFNEDGAYPQEGAETAGGNSQAIDTGRVRGVESGATGVQRIDEAVSEASSQARDGEARPEIQDRGLDPNTSTAATETEPNGSVSRSGPEDFALDSYTEGDIANLENRDIEALNAQEQMDREGENFALSGGDAAVETGRQRIQNAQSSDLFGFADIQPAANRDVGFEPTRARITAKLNQLGDKDILDLLREPGFQLKGTRQEKIERIVSAREALFVLQNNNYESATQISEAIKSGEIDAKDAARWSEAINKTQNSRSNYIATETNANNIATIARRLTKGELDLPFRTESEQQAFDAQQPTQTDAPVTEPDVQAKARDEQVATWFRENSAEFVQWWESSLPSERLKVLEAAGAQGDTDRKAKRRSASADPDKMGGAARGLVAEWATDNWDSYISDWRKDPANFTPAQIAESLGRTEDAARLIKEEEARNLALEKAEQPSLAPENRTADSGVSEEQLNELVSSLQEARKVEDSLEEGQRITRVFEAPKDEDVVRLRGKVNAYVDAKGFMSPEKADRTIQSWKDNARQQGENRQTRNENAEKVVISLFDLSGEWSKPWVEAGYEVYQFDIQENAYVGDVNNFSVDFFNDLFTAFDGKEIHAILAACPCTDFAGSGARHFSAKDKDGRTFSSVEVVQQTLRTIEYFKPAVWALENPVGRIAKMNGMPPWRLSFDPFHFGEDYTKQTLLWGRFNADLPVAPTEPVAGSKMHSQYGGKSIATKNARSVTPEGFAYAFFEANNAIDHPVMTVQNTFDMMDPAVLEKAVRVGMSFQDIDYAVADDYYANLDVDAAKAALEEEIAENYDDSDTAFSLRRGATRNRVSVTDKELDTVFKRVTGKDRNDSESVLVVPSYTDLPQDIRDRAENMGTRPSEVRGVFHRGSIYVVRDQIKGKNDFEEVLLHEATHGGFRDMLGDRGVNTALNKLFASMGGREGLEQTLIDLGIEADLQPYKDSLEKEGGSVDRRNAILLDEMLAFTGQKGSKGIKLRIQELIGAIRAWLAKNGYVNLSKTRASDIALMARRARENYFANSTDRSDTAFSLAQRKARAQKNDQGLYSNAEQTILDEGNKIFKASKKNPDASVRGDQILSFLKGRGIKKDELQFTRLEEFLTEPQPQATMADFENAKPRRYTQEEVIAYLRDAAPEFTEEGVDGTNKRSDGLNWGESEVLDDPDYYQYLTDDIIYEASREQWDEYNASQALDKVFRDNPEKLNEMLESKGINPSNLEQPENDAARYAPLAASVALAFEKQNESLWDAIQGSFEYEFNEVARDLARDVYLDSDPYVRVDGFYNAGEVIRIEGSPDTGFSITDDSGRRVNAEEIYDLDEAKVQAQMHLYDEGELSDNGDTRFFDYLGIGQNSNEDMGAINNYREIRQQLENNSLESNDKEFEGGHWDESNVLYHTLVTDRTWPFGEVYVIEELQSDWHNDIRKQGGTYDAAAVADARDALDKADRKLQDLAKKKSQTFEEIRDAAALKNSAPGMRAAIRGQDVETYLQYKNKNIFSKKGFEKIASIYDEGQTREYNNNKFLEAFSPGAIPELWFSQEDLQREIADGGESVGLNPLTPEEISEARSLFTPEVLEAGRRRKEAFERGESDLVLDATVRSLLPVAWWGDLNSESFREGVRRSDILRLGLQDELFGDNLEAVEKYKIEKEGYDAADASKTAARKEMFDAESTPPNSPFRDDRYLELAAKRAVIQAVSENKDAIAFSKADRVQNRWSENFDYEAIYNKKFRKIMEKITGQTAQSVDLAGFEEDTTDGFWSYELTPELKEQIEYDGLPMFSLRPEEGSIRIPKKGETKIADRFIQGLQDKFLPIKRLQQSIEETRGRGLFEEEDAYLAEEMFYGKTEEDLRQIELEFVEPLVKDMESSGISMKELDDFLMAKHAPERNREVAKINPALPDGGSGLTTREANEHLASVAEDPQKLANLERLAGRVYEMTTLTRELLVNGGLISEEEVSSWDSKYQFYVPLKGFADNELNDKGFAIRTGKGYEIQGKESRRALGRRSKADSPLVQVMADLTEKTIRNRKNEVGQSLLKLAENNPDSMFWQVFTADNPDTKDTWNAQAKKVVTGPVDMARDDRYFGVKRDGKAYYIRIEDQRILDTMRKVGPQAQGVLINAMGAATRWLSFVNTAANPQFVITNFLRDIQAAGINILAEQSKEGGRIEGEELAARAVNLKNVGGAVAAIADYHRNKRTQPKAGNDYQAYYQEFMETGGKTGFFDSPDLDKIAKDLNGRLKEAGVGKKVKEVGKNILDFVTDYNTSVENGIRLSTYVEARKVGLSPKKASSLAKNLTVNFNRKGDHGQVLNSAYMFFNAAVQGLAQFSATMSPFQVDSKGDWKLQRRVNTAQKVAGGIIVSAAMLANLNRLVGGEDDDGEAYWDKVSPAIRERNIVFMKPDGSGEYYKFPLPYGYNFFYNLGDVLEGSVYGSARRKPKLMSQALESFITAFSPMALHSADTLGERMFISATPSIAVPAAELVTNTNFFGGDIVREPNPYGAQMAASHNYWSTTKGPYIAIAQFMNDTVGNGSSYKSGSVDPLGFMFDADVLDISTDVSPDTLEHLLEYSLGGIYRTGTGVAEAANRYFSGRENTAATVPFINKLVGRDTSDFSDRSNYYDIRQEITNARTEYRDSDNKREAVAKHNGLHLLYRSTLGVDKRLARLREQEDRARDSKRLSARDRDDKLLELREKMDDEIDRFYIKYRNHLSRRAEKQ